MRTHETMQGRHYTIDLDGLNFAERELICQHLKDYHESRRYCWIAYDRGFATSDRLLVYEDNIAGITRFLLDNFNHRVDVIDETTGEIIEY